MAGARWEHLARRASSPPDRPRRDSRSRRLIGVLSVEAGPAAKSSPPTRNATDGALCATRREVRVTGLTAGPVLVSLQASSHRPGGLAGATPAYARTALLEAEVGPVDGAVVELHDQLAAGSRPELVRLPDVGVLVA